MFIFDGDYDDGLGPTLCNVICTECGKSDTASTYSNEFKNGIYYKLLYYPHKCSCGHRDSIVMESQDEYDEIAFMDTQSIFQTDRDKAEKHLVEKAEQIKTMRRRSFWSALILPVMLLGFLAFFLIWNIILLSNGLLIFWGLWEITENLGVSIYLAVFLELLIMDSLFRNVHRFKSHTPPILISISEIIGRYQLTKWFQLLLTVLITAIDLLHFEAITNNAIWEIFTDAFFPAVLSALLFEEDMVKPYIDIVRKRKKKEEQEKKEKEIKIKAQLFLEIHLIARKAEKEYVNGYLDVMSQLRTGCTLSEVQQYSKSIFNHIKVTYIEYFADNPLRKDEEITLTDLYVWKEKQLFGTVGTRAPYDIPKEIAHKYC